MLPDFPEEVYGGLSVVVIVDARSERGRTSTHDHEGIGGLLGRDWGIEHAVDLNGTEITREEIGH